jgi:hypothetical protein
MPSHEAGMTLDFAGSLNVHLLQVIVLDLAPYAMLVALAEAHVIPSQFEEANLTLFRI